MRLLSLMMLLLLWACESGDAPIVIQPPTPQVKISKITDVRVELVEGPAVPMAKLLSSSVAAGLNEHGVSASIQPNEPSRYVLKGKVEANWEDRRVPFVMLIYWTLEDLGGATLGTYTQGVRGARWKWEYGDPRIIRAVGNGAAKPIAAMIVEDDVKPLPSLLLGTGILVEPVTGAPGDGNRALYRAIANALAALDVSITEDRRQASLILNGQVGFEPGEKQDKILIVWRVMTLDGFEVGRATQENVVPAGALDEQWGVEAENIAEAAVIGIERIIGATPSHSAPSLQTPDGQPPAPDLQQVPGRAPPPPS